MSTLAYEELNLCPIKMHWLLKLEDGVYTLEGLRDETYYQWKIRTMSPWVIDVTALWLSDGFEQDEQVLRILVNGYIQSIQNGYLFILKREDRGNGDTEVVFVSKFDSRLSPIQIMRRSIIDKRWSGVEYALPVTDDTALEAIASIANLKMKVAA